MHSSMDSGAASRVAPLRLSLSIGPLYEIQNRHVVQAGALVIATGLVGPRPFWDPFPRWQPGDPPRPILWEEA